MTNRMFNEYDWKLPTEKFKGIVDEVDVSEFSEIYKKFDRTNYEIAILFKKSYEVLRMINSPLLRDHIFYAKAINNQFLPLLLNYSDNINFGKRIINLKINGIIERHYEFIIDMVDFVFGKILNDTGGEFGEITPSSN